MDNQPQSAAVIGPREWISRGFYVSLGVALLWVLAWAVRELGAAVLAIVTPFAVGGGIALLIDPVIRRVQSHQIRRSMSVFLIFGAFLCLTGGCAYLTIPVLISQADTLATEGPASIQQLNNKASNFLKEHHGKIGPFKLPKNLSTWKNISDTASAYLQRSAGDVAAILLGTAKIVLQTVISIIVTFYLLIDYDRLRARLFFLIPDRYRGIVRTYVGDVGGVFAQYVRGLVLECVLYSACMIVLLEALSRAHPQLAGSALLVGALAGVLYTVPYLGAITIGLLTFLIAFTAGGPGFALVAVACAFAINQIFDYVVTPRLIGGGVGLHPVVALFAMALGAAMFFPWGLLLSVPLAGSVQVILFRLFPKLSVPTPPEFLRRESVGPGDAEAPKIPMPSPKVEE